MPSSRSARLIALVAFALLATACDDAVEWLRRLQVRASQFQHTDRIFLDDDNDPRCFDPVDGSNATVAGQLTRSLRQEVSAADGHFDRSNALTIVGQNQGGFPFLGDPLKGGELCSPVSKHVAGGYYAATGMPATMGEWCIRYGLAPDCQTSDLDTVFADTPSDLQISYFNAHALPVFRVTLCNRVKGPGFACVNLNFVCPERLPGGVLAEAVKSDLEPEDRLSVAEALCDPATPGCNPCEAVSVTMQFDYPRFADGEIRPDTDPIVIFGAYRGVGPDAPLMDRIDLDFSGVEDPYETIPNICNNCHGGQAYAPLDPRDPSFADLDMGSQFLPINPPYAMRDKDALFAFLDGDEENGLDFGEALMRIAPIHANARTLVGDAEVAFGVGGPNRQDGRQRFKPGVVAREKVIPGEPARLDVSGDLPDTLQMNRLFLKTDVTPGNRVVLEGIIRKLEALLDDGAPYPEVHEDDDRPPTWVAEEIDAADYRLVAEHCTDSCHLGLVAEVDFFEFDEFNAYRDSTFFDLCRDYSMPQSPESFNLFWSKSARVGSASRGDDVEAFLTRAFGAKWPPLLDEQQLDAECPIPPLVFGAALGQPEFTSPQVLRAKADACRAELAAEGGRADLGAPRLRNCRFLCADEVLRSEFEESAAITAATCDVLVQEGLGGVDGQLLEQLRDRRGQSGRASWARDVATSR